MQYFQLNCEILSPVHIGTEQEIEPFEYVIANGKFYRIRLEQCLAELPEAAKQKFYELVEQGKINDVRRLIAQHVDLEKHAIYQTAVTSGIETIYRSKLGDLRNQLIIKPFIRTDVTYCPYIPGSSLKGALRTAVISERAVKSGLPKPKNFMEEVHFEAKVLNYSDAKNDPFRAIKISDALLDPDATLIAEVKNVRKNRRGHLEAISIQMFSEVTHSKISGKELTFTTKLWIDNDLQHKKGVSQTITIDEIIQANQAFYLDKMKLDDAFYQQSEVQPCSSQLLRESFDNNSFPLRIGRFSGVWSVTLDKYRNPQPPRGRGYGHSKNVADGKFPMGWIKVTVTPASQRQ